MNLIVGATGLLGGQICQLLAERGKPVRALVRDTSNPDKVATLRNIGAEIVLGDLKDRQELQEAQPAPPPRPPRPQQSRN